MKPRIGITTSYQDGKQQLDHHYVDAVLEAGGLPIIVPMLHDEDSATEFAALLDGLIITGGPGITRGLIGDLPEDLPPVDPLRDQSDFLIYNAMMAKPIFGICYGMQFINAMHGGSIYSDLNVQIPGAAIHSSARGGTNHRIQIQAGSRLAQLLGSQETEVNTYHIQAIAEIGKGLNRSALSSDGVIEAIETTDRRILGVQFHPERMGEKMKSIFVDFVDGCQKTR